MSDWISVDECLPPSAKNGIWDSKEYLVCINDPYGTRTNRRIICRWINSRWQGFPKGAIDVTHWMPLPEPPKSE